MKIAIEAQRIFRNNKHGMDFVALETIRELQRIDTENEYFILVGSKEDKCLKESANMHIVEIGFPTYPLWEQIGLPLALKIIKPDLLHCTSNTAPLWCNVPLILTLHDIIFLEKKQGKNKSLYQNIGWYYRKTVVPPVLPKCKRIITVSHFERNRIKAALKLDDVQIITVYNGFSSHFKPLTQYRETVRKYIDQDNYLFFLGNTDPKKNTLRTLKAYSMYVHRSSFPKHLLIADLKEEIIDHYLKQGGIEDIKPYLHFPGYIPNADLPAIYNGAYAFLYTSLRESFGIPILEAMACGTPVVTSNASAIPEIAGEGAILVNPESEEEIADYLLKLENNPEIYHSQICYGKERSELFSWKKTARELLTVYQSVYKENDKP